MATIEEGNVVKTRPTATSPFVTGYFPARPWRIVGIGALVGFVFTVIWSAAFVDSTIGDRVANAVMGDHAREMPIETIWTGIAFAFAAGLACTFTACNVAAFGAIGPLLTTADSRRAQLVRTLKPLGWLSVGMIGISAVYGVLVGLFGTSMAQYSTATVPAGTMSARNWQSLVVFGAIGLAMIYLGMAAAGLLPDPFRNISQRWPNAPMVIMGVLIGALTIGRPFGLYRKLFRDAAESGNVFYGAAAWTLHSIGNILVMVVIFLALAYGTRGRLQRWFSEKPTRLTAFIVIGLVAAGVFTFLYWDIRALARRDILPWYPMIEW